jgi:hypothetical protein
MEGDVAVRGRQLDVAIILEGCLCDVEVLIAVRGCQLLLNVFVAALTRARLSGEWKEGEGDERAGSLKFGCTGL